MPPVESSCSPRGVPGQAQDSPDNPQATNGVGHLPHEEAADAVVKEKSLRPW